MGVSTRDLLPPVETRDKFPVDQFDVGLILYSIGTSVIWGNIKTIKIKCLPAPQPDTFMFLLTNQVSSPSFKYPQLQGGTHVSEHFILYMNVWIDSWEDRCMDGWVDEWMDAWMDVNINNRIGMFFCIIGGK